MSIHQPSADVRASRRGFLSGLASLPLIGGSVALLGQPTAAATPVTEALLWSYRHWLHMEHRMLSYEMADHDVKRAGQIEDGFSYILSDGSRVPNLDWHMQWSGQPGARGPAGWITAPQPSSRAAVILSAAGVPLTEERARG